jgi:hypothetical protein
MPQDKSIGVVRGFFGLGVNAELLPIFYIVLKSYSSPKRNAKISQRHWLLKAKPSTFTLVTSQHFTIQPTCFQHQDERDYS